MPDPKINQTIDGQYIEIADLNALLQKLFGEGNYTLQVRVAVANGPRILRIY